MIGQLVILKLKILIAFSSALLLAGCATYQQWFQTLVPRDEDEFVRRFIEFVREGQIDASINMLDPTVRTDDTVSGLAQIRQLLSQGEPQSIESIGVRFEWMEGKKRTFLTYQNPVFEIMDARRCNY